MTEDINDYSVGYSTWEDKRRRWITVKATSHRLAGKKVEQMIRDAGDTPKTVGTATQLTSDPHSAI